MKTCRTCRHWTTYYESQRGQHENSAAPCLAIERKADVIIDQGRGYASGGATVESIDTHSDFGCVLHEPLADVPADGVVEG